MRDGFGLVGSVKKQNHVSLLFFFFLALCFPLTLLIYLCLISLLGPRLFFVFPRSQDELSDDESG